MNSTLDKINLYILSLGMLFLFVVIITVQLPESVIELQTPQGWAGLARRNIVSLISAGLLVYCVGVFMFLCWKLRGATDIPFEVKKVEGVDYEHLTFLATYVVPLISFDFESWRQLLVLGLLLVAMGAIYVKTNLFYANPSLALLGFRLFRVDGNFKNGDRQGIIVICRERLSVGQKVGYIKLDDNIYYATRATK